MHALQDAPHAYTNEAIKIIGAAIACQPHTLA
jgi:hypothetical protein